MEKEISVNCQNLGQKNRLLSKILDKYKKCNDKNVLAVLKEHLCVYLEYMTLFLQGKGSEVFSNRLMYQKFQVSKVIIDKIDLLEFTVDPSLKGFAEYKDMRSPPIEAFTMTRDMKEAKKITFCRNIDKGDILHLRVVEEYETEYKLLVINKYNEKERAADYLIYAYLMKSYQLEKLPRPLQVSDFIRAAVFGKLKMEGNVFSKLLVTLNYNLVNEKYKDIWLGLVSEPEIPFYPEDLSNFNSFLNYMKANKGPDDPQEMIKCMASLGIDPYKTYSFHECYDGKKLGKPKEIDHWTMEVKRSEKSMDLVKEAEKQLVQGKDHKSVLPLLEEALKLYPMNDAVYAIRGQLYKQLFLSEKDSTYLIKALEDFQKSLDINGYNVIAIREYLTILILSLESFKESEEKEKIEKIMEVILEYKDVYDVTQLLPDDDDEEET